MALRFCRPNSSSTANSWGKRSCPLATPWVMLLSMKPPLRPLACEPTSCASISTTSRLGSRSLAMMAVHKPLYPPPTTHRSQLSLRTSVGLLSGSSTSSYQ